MAYRMVLISALLLVGCGGNDFHTLFGPGADASDDSLGGEPRTAGAGGKRAERLLGSGGAAEEDAGIGAGGVDQGAGGAGSGGANSGGAAPSAAGGSSSAGAASDCPADQKKLCAGKCVSYAEATPSIGCWEAACTPCAPPPAHSHALCTNGQCDFACDEGYQRSADSAQCISACQETVHNDGLGQMWSDCVPLGTFTQDQAEKACEAWCAVNGACHCELGTFCGDSNQRVYTQWRSSFMTWVWQGDAGDVVQADPGSAGQPACTTVSNWQ